MPAPIAPTYAIARERFATAAANAGARLESHEHPLRGIEGERLWLDLAALGPHDADDVLLIVSGTHGVEGYLGSALQTHHLTSDDLPRVDDVLVLFLHALNPYGFSWTRRVNEDNVDLNRNFVDWSQPPPPNPEYAEFATTLVPEDWSEATQERTFNELANALAERGLEALQAIFTRGQFDDPTGIFHGGTGPTWSHQRLVEIIEQRLASRSRVAVLDLHTGLGPWGHGELISPETPGTAAFERQVDWWGDVTSQVDGSSVSANLNGDWETALQRLLPDPEVTAVGIEYGTVDEITVLQSLRADAVLHASAEPRSPQGDEIRAQVRAAFIDDDPAWFDACLRRYIEVTSTALTRLHG